MDEQKARKQADGKTAPYLDEHHGGPTDPEGHVSSGLQGGPLREKGGRPVADIDEATGPSSRERDLAEKNVTRADLRRHAEGGAQVDDHE